MPSAACIMRVCVKYTQLQKGPLHTLHTNSSNNPSMPSDKPFSNRWNAEFSSLQAPGYLLNLQLDWNTEIHLPQHQHQPTSTCHTILCPGGTNSYWSGAIVSYKNSFIN